MTTLSTRLGSELRFRFASSAFAAETFDVVNLVRSGLQLPVNLDVDAVNEFQVAFPVS